MRCLTETSRGSAARQFMSSFLCQQFTSWFYLLAAPRLYLQSQTNQFNQNKCVDVNQNVYKVSTSCNIFAQIIS